MRKKIIYLDWAASSLKPETVIDTASDFLKNKYANASRGICPRAAAVDAMITASRALVACFINAPDARNIAFTSGATDALNRIPGILLVNDMFKSKPTVIVSDLDHHSARLPWEVLSRCGRVNIDVCGLDKDFNLDVKTLKKAGIFVITAMSNVLGRGQDVKKIIAAARAINPDIITIVDAAQYVAHRPIDVTDWDCDFMCFSGHKIGTDTGVGVMYIKNPDKWSPEKFGGGMMKKIIAGEKGSGDEWILSDAPEKFEAGTLPLTQISGIAPAIDYMISNGDNHGLIEYLHGELSNIEKIKLITRADDSVLTFVVDGMHCLDFGALAGARGICLRVGNMCASWLHRAIGHEGTIRISCGPSNTMDEMKEVVRIIKEIVK